MICEAAFMGVGAQFLLVAVNENLPFCLREEWVKSWLSAEY